ncbi:MAG: hypothetical protein AAF629_31640 [Chloroflexota bacterium]
MDLDRDQLQKDIWALYDREHQELGEDGTLRQLEEARQWDLSSTLSSGGVVVFPHAGVLDCGHQIAAAVHACLDSGADQVLVISVLHAFTDEMQQARIRVAQGGDPSQETHWGIQGSGIVGPRQEWKSDHALYSFRHFWQAETKRRGIKGPKVIERYPYLAGGKPEQLPGFEDIATLAKDAVIVSTADAFHHGIGYGDPPKQAFAPDEGGLSLAQSTLEEGIDILEKGDYWGYNQHCVDAKSDARDAGQLFRCLRGPMKGQILDLVYTDASTLYNQPPPTWVAGALFEWQLTA